MMAINYMGYVMGRKGKYIRVERDERTLEFDSWSAAMRWVEDENRRADHPVEEGEISLCQK